MRRAGLSRLSGEDLRGGSKNIASWKLPSGGQRGQQGGRHEGPQPLRGHLWASRGLPATAATACLVPLWQVTLSGSHCSRHLPCPTLPSRQQPPALPPTAGRTLDSPSKIPPAGAGPHDARGPGRSQGVQQSGLCDPGLQPVGQACQAPIPGRTWWCRAF